MSIKVTPEILFDCLCINLKYWLLKFSLEEAMGIMINGTANPNEYADNKTIPSITVWLLEDKVSNAPRTGPMHGVKPKAKVKPRTKFFKILNLAISI